MSKLFYDHLIEIEETHIELEKLEISGEEKEDLVTLIDEIVFQTVLGIVLSELPEDHHEAFLEKFLETPHSPELLEFLRSQGRDIEAKLKSAAWKLKKEILSEILGSLP